MTLSHVYDALKAASKWNYLCRGIHCIPLNTPLGIHWGVRAQRCTTGYISIQDFEVSQKLQYAEYKGLPFGILDAISWLS